MLFNRISDSQIVSLLILTCYKSYNLAQYLALTFLACSGWILSPPTAPKRAQKTNHDAKLVIILAFLAFWFAQPMLASPILPHPLPAPYTRPDYPLRILSAEQSVTGLITVAEVLPFKTGTDTDIHSVRYLRASHSILGGVWLYDKVYMLDGQQPEMDSLGTPLGDSIYAAFVLQEAVRLVNSTRKTDKLKQGLIMLVHLGCE